MELARALFNILGGSAYTTSNGHSNGSTTPNDYFPQMEFVTFAQVPKMEALKTKLLEFNKKVPEPVQVPEEQIQKLTLFGKLCVLFPRYNKCHCCFS